MPPQTPQTPQAFKAMLRAMGITHTQWCREHNLDPVYASRVLNGSIKAIHGKGHDYAVKMGIKTPPTLTP